LFVRNFEIKISCATPYVWCISRIRRNLLTHLYFGNSTQHELNQQSLCLLCEELISRAVIRKSKKDRFVTQVKIAASLKDLLPSFDSSKMPWLPTVVCPSHRILLGHPKRSIDEEIISAVQLRISATIAVRNAAARCHPDHPCTLCRRCSQLRQRSNLQLPAPPKRTAEFEELPPKPKRVRRDKKPPTQPSPPVSRLSRGDLIAMGSAANVSGFQKGQMADEQRRRFKSGSSTVSAESGSVVRKQQTLFNTTFSHDFQTKLCRFSSTDGGIHFCSDLTDFTHLYCWLREKSVDDVVLIKLNGDAGQGSLKLMIQFIFAGDPIFSDDPHAARAASPSHDHLDTGVHHTYILALIHGCSESHASVTFLFAAVDLRLLHTIFSKAQIVLPVDMKFANVCFGLQPHGAAKSYLWTLWSSFIRHHSAPDDERSLESITADAKRYLIEAAELEEKSPSAERLDPIDFNSTEALPILFLQTFSPTSLLIMFPPPPLHLLLGITKTLFHFLEVLDMDLANDWLFSINVRRSERHGGSDFTGNDCRKIISNTTKLQSCHRFPHRTSKRYNSRELHRLTATKLLCEATASFDVVVSRTMGLRLHPEWSASIEEFHTSFAAFTVPYNKFSSPQAGRNADRITPKLQCLFHEVVLWISSNNCSLNRHTEQAFETLHKVYLNFEQRYSVPRTGPEILPARRLKKALPNNKPQAFVGRHTPSSGTRSGNTKRKRSLLKNPEPSSSPSKRTRRPVVGAVRKARQRRLNAVIAFNSSNLPSDSFVQERQLRAIARIKFENCSASSSSSPKNFSSDGREGDSLTSHVREWRSNDVSFFLR